MTRQYLIPSWGYVNETGTKDYLIPGQGYIDETSAGTPGLLWIPAYPSEVSPPVASAKNSFFAEPIIPIPIAQTNWYPAYNNAVTAAPLRTAYNLFSEPIIPSPIGQNNWYPVYDPQVKSGALGAKNSYFAELLASPAALINWGAVYSAEVKAAPTTARFSAFVELLSTPIPINNWYPTYSSQIKTSPLNPAGFVTPPIPAISASVTVLNWFPVYAAEVKVAPAAVRYSYFAEMLAAPIAINNWCPDYTSEVKAAPSNNIAVAVSPIPAIATSFTPIGWYPSYSPDLAKNVAIAQCGTVQPFNLISPIAPSDVLLGGKAYLAPYDKYREDEYQSLKTKHAELQKINEELADAEEHREKKISESKNKRLAKKLEAKLQEEISRLRIERAWLMRLIDDEEAILVLLLSSPFN